MTTRKQTPETPVIGLRLLAARELRHRFFSFLLGVSATAIACGTLVGTLAVLSLHEQATRDVLEHKERELDTRLANYNQQLEAAMGRLGFNVTILPAGQNLSDWYADDFASETMPETIIETLHEAGLVTIENLVARLTGRIEWAEGKRVALVVGEALSSKQASASAALPQPPAPGTVEVGYGLHSLLSLSAGKTMDLNGRRFTVARCLPEQGTKEDITIRMALIDAQALLERPGRINEIRAIQCRCAWSESGQVAAELEKVLPGGLQVVEEQGKITTIRMARDMMERESRSMLEQERKSRVGARRQRRRLGLALSGLAALVAACWVALTTRENCRARRVEVGVLRALGMPVRSILDLFLRRTVLEAVLGAVAGFLATAWVAQDAGFEIICWFAAALGVACIVSLPAAVAAALLVSRADAGLTLKNDV
ncbi:MAG: hypothetical protein KAI66_14050 [Lentisphaeria bacterium]|nr:hypothetical protein [Lentisphaeria bacterium]